MAKWPGDGGSISAAAGLVGKRVQQFGAGFEKVVGRAEDETAAGAGLGKAAPDLGTRFLRRSGGKEAVLVETADKADLVADAPLRLSQPHVAAHGRRREGLERVGAEPDQALQDRHHPAARVIRNP